MILTIELTPYEAACLNLAANLSGLSLHGAIVRATETANNFPATEPASPAPAETPEPTPPPAAARGILARAAAFTAAAVQASN